MNESAHTLTALAEELLDGPLQEERMRRYHSEAVAAGQFDQALRVFESLAGHHPRNVAVRSLLIALCLSAGDPGRGMPHIEHLLAATKPSDGLLDAALDIRRRLAAQTVHPRLSLCMIVRDEATRLPACLHAIKPLADEMIVVDTGSTDRTMDIARAFGAHVLAVEWRKDFAAARNAALQHARGRWILVLDADEIIAPDDFDTLRKLMDTHEDGASAFSIQTRNYCHTANLLGWQANDGRYPSQEAGLGWIGSTKVRLFPRREEIRFHFPVHERVEPSLRKAGIAIVPCDVPVHHYGHLNALQNRRKALGYYELGMAKLEQMNGDLPSLRELAVQAGQLEHWDEALDLWRRVLAIDPDFVEAHVNTAGLCWQTGDYEQALRAARRALRHAPHHREAHFNEAVSLLMLGRAGEAIPCLQVLSERYPDYWSGLFMLAAACAASGDTRRCRSILKNLETTAAGPALNVTIEDLTRRMRRHGLADYARSLSCCRIAELDRIS